MNYRSSSRVGKTAKRHLVDPSLCCASLQLTTDKLLHDHETFGFLFESLVERDLRIYADYLDGHLYHFRDNTSGDEVDAIIEDVYKRQALYGSYCLFPALKQFAIYPPDFESAFLGCVCIDEDFSKFGIGERLLLSVEKDLIERQYKSVETTVSYTHLDVYKRQA